MTDQTRPIRIDGNARIGPRLPLQTINDLLATPIRACPDSSAILAPERDPLSFAGLGRMLRSVAKTLAQSGYGRGARIAIALPPGPEQAVAILAVSTCASCAPLNPELDEATLRHLLVAMRIDALIVAAGDRSGVVRAARGADVAIVELQVESGMRAGEFTLAPAARRSPARIEAPGVEDIALLTHTSGTTSLPKIVPLKHRCITEASRAAVEFRGITRDDRALQMAPLFNVAGIRRNLLPPLAVGGSVLCPGQFDPAQFVACLSRYAPTLYFAAAATHIAVLEALARDAAPPRHSLRMVFSGTAMLPAPVFERLEQILGVPVLEGYGMTEVGAIAQAPQLPAHTPRGSVGIPTNIEIVIADDTGASLGPGSVGEIIVRGPEMFDGYENDDAANAAAFRDGWFRTGDVGYLDHGGHLFVSGRIKDQINRGGTKIAPAVVEEALAQHPCVAAAAAFATPHATLGEDVAAVVVLKAQDVTSEDDLREFVRRRLAAFQVPTRIVAVPELPRGALGKVKRGELPELLTRHDPRRFVAPRDREEATIVGVFAEVLGHDRIGADDNFFQLGGDSLRAARVAALVGSSFGVAIPLDLLFRQPTGAGLAAVVRAALADRGAVAPAPPISRTVSRPAAGARHRPSEDNE